MRSKVVIPLYRIGVPNYFYKLYFTNKMLHYDFALINHGILVYILGISIIKCRSLFNVSK